MSEKIFEKMNDEALGGVAGGMTRNMAAAYDVMNGKYGNGAERKAKLTAAGYDKVAKEVINGKYGNGASRVAALKAAGFDPVLVQDIVNGILL